MRARGAEVVLVECVYEGGVAGGEMHGHGVLTRSQKEMSFTGGDRGGASPFDKFDDDESEEYSDDFEDAGVSESDQDVYDDGGANRVAGGMDHEFDRVQTFDEAAAADAASFLQTRVGGAGAVEGAEDGHHHHHHHQQQQQEQEQEEEEREEPLEEDHEDPGR